MDIPTYMALEMRMPRVGGVPPHGRAADLVVAVQMEDGRWLNAISLAPPPVSFWRWSTLLSLSLTALVLSGVIVFRVRRITWPLARLALAADRFGRGETVPPLAEQGPLDVRETIRAFNHMRARLERFVQDRIHMLATISHDSVRLSPPCACGWN